MRDYAEVIARVQTTSGVVAMTPFILSQAMLTSENSVHGIVLRGIDPKTAGRVINIEKILKKGTMDGLQTPGEAGPPGIFVGKELAQNLGVMLGDTVVVVSPAGTLTPMGTGPPMKKFRVTGIFDSGMYEYDTSLAYISLKNAQKFLGMDDHRLGRGGESPGYLRRQEGGRKNPEGALGSLSGPGTGCR